jgi:two-component system, LytTR family, sensor kinase
VALGIAYWLAWAVLSAGYYRLVDPRVAAVDPGEFLVRLVVFTALIALTLYAAMALIFETGWYRGRVRDRDLQAARLQVELEEARAAALRARVDPAFLTRTCAVAAELMTRDVPRARTVLADLSELLRTALGRELETTIPLRRELELARRFSAIQQARLDDAVAVEFDADDAVLERPVPPLHLQPLLEEAFRWLAGDAPRAGQGPRGTIRIAARAAGAGEALVVTAALRAGDGAGRTADVGTAEGAAARAALQERLARRYHGAVEVDAGAGDGPDAPVQLRLRIP